MKAAVLNEFGSVEKFEILDVPTPKPGSNEVLVKVLATSVNPLDFQVRRGDYKMSYSFRLSPVMMYPG